MTLNARFPWASVTKQATAALVLGLVGEGRLDLNAPLATYLPQPRPTGPGATLRQLLTNTSGLVDPTDVALDYYTRSDSAASVAVDAGLMAALAFEPGSQFRYDLDFLALGRVVEAVTGRPYADVLRDCVLVPAGMATTALLQDDRVEARVPTGYVARDSADVAAGGGHSDRWTPSASGRMAQQEPRRDGGGRVPVRPGATRRTAVPSGTPGHDVHGGPGARIRRARRVHTASTWAAGRSPPSSARAASGALQPQPPLPGSGRRSRRDEQRGHGRPLPDIHRAGFSYDFARQPCVKETARTLCPSSNGGLLDSSVRRRRT